MSAVSLIPPAALSLGRYCKALAVAKGDVLGAQAMAEGHRIPWRDTPDVFTTLRAAVDALSTGSGLGYASASGLLLPLIRNNTLVDRLALRRVPLNTTVASFSGDASAHVVAQGAPKPLSKFSLATLSVLPQKVSAAIVVSDELVRNSDPSAETALGTELAKAVTARMDLVFADPNVGGSISNGATTISSGGSSMAALDSDFRSMLNSLAATGDEALQTAVWIMSSATAIYIAGIRGSGGNLAFPFVNAKGGTLLGLPVFTTGAMIATGSPGESAILLVDQQQILFGDEGQANVSLARDASVQLSDTPASPATSTVSLFQANLLGLLGERWCGWSRIATSSVVVLDNISFAV